MMVLMMIRDFVRKSLFVWNGYDIVAKFARIAKTLLIKITMTITTTTSSLLEDLGERLNI